MAKNPDEMAATMRANVEAKTGKKMSAWLKLLAASGKQKHGERVNWLKSEHDVTHGFANLIVHDAKNASGSAAPAGDGLIDAQYAGAKGELRPIYDALLAAIGKLGKDVELAPKKAYVSLRRSKQFGLVQPSTKTRVDLGLNLKGVAPTERLEASGSFNAMVSHRVRLTEAKQVDRELKAWIKRAYESA